MSIRKMIIFGIVVAITLILSAATIGAISQQASSIYGMQADPSPGKVSTKWQMTLQTNELDSPMMKYDDSYEGRFGLWGTGAATMGPQMMGTSYCEDEYLDASTIRMANNVFYPQTLVVQKGTIVTWINMDWIIHAVKSGTHDDSGGLFDSGNLEHMDQFSYIFGEIGEYIFHCDLHPGMVGKIVVVE